MNQLLFLFKNLFDKLLVVSAQVFDIASVLLLKFSFRLNPSIQILHFYDLDWCLISESCRSLLLWLLFHLCRSLNFLDISRCNLSRRLRPLKLAHPWRP